MILPISMLGPHRVGLAGSRQVPIVAKPIIGIEPKPMDNDASTSIEGVSPHPCASDKVEDKKLGEREISKFREMSDAEQLSFIACLVAKRILPDGHISGEFWRASVPVAPAHAVKPISVNLITGSWRSFGAAQSGPDITSLIAYVAGVDDERAEAVLNSMLSELKGENQNEE
jgi:hypothetical protein